MACIENGFFQKEQNEAIIKQLEEIKSGKRIMVGVNKYVEDEDVEVPVFQWDPKAEEVAVERLRKLRRERDNELVKKTLNLVKEAALNGADLMPVYIEAAKAQATLGEIMGELRGVFGIFDERAIPGYGAV